MRETLRDDLGKYLQIFKNRKLCIFQDIKTFTKNKKLFCFSFQLSNTLIGTMDIKIREF